MNQELDESGSGLADDDDLDHVVVGRVAVSELDAGRTVASGGEDHLAAAGCLHMGTFGDHTTSNDLRRATAHQADGHPVVTLELLVHETDDIIGTGGELDGALSSAESEREPFLAGEGSEGFLGESAIGRLIVGLHEI